MRRRLFLLARVMPDPEADAGVREMPEAVRIPPRPAGVAEGREPERHELEDLGHDEDARFDVSHEAAVSPRPRGGGRP